MLNYNHLLHMTDDTGMLQFSRYDIPDPQSGYTLDDNARALLATLYMGEKAYPCALKYMSFLTNAQRPDGSWSNFLLGGKYYSRFDSEDSRGRALMACGAATLCIWPDLVMEAGKLINHQLSSVVGFSSPRAIAYTLIGLCKGKMPCSDRELHEMVNRLAGFLTDLYGMNKKRNWFWFEEYLTYCNAVLPNALFCVYSFNGDKKCLKIAHESITFLNDILFRDGYLNIIGNQGWYHRKGTLPYFDQQPVDAAATAFACWEAYQCLGKHEYIDLANLAYQWFMGKNINGISLYDETTGGCFDALIREGVNGNQGAESLLSLVLTELLMDSSIRSELQGVKSS